MGQKTHPKGFRLVTTQKHLSNWYSKRGLYPERIREDFFIREKVSFLFKDLLTLSKIEITRIDNSLVKKDQINIKVYALYPRAKEMQKKALNFFAQQTSALSGINLTTAEENLKEFISLSIKQKSLDILRSLQKQTNNIYTINFEFIKNPFEDATLIAKYIAEQLEKRVPFRRAVKQAIKKIQFTSKKGLKIQVSGRLNGIDIARSEWRREGKIPLHTLNAHIDYTHQEANTIYGVIGIKVWLFEQVN